MTKILITGGSGAIGRRLISKLQAKGHAVCVIGRTKHENLGVPSFTWDLNEGTLDERALSEITHIIHLAGAGITDKSWSPSRKQEIVVSRVKPLELLADFLKRRNQRIDAIISSSAVGYYGAITSDKIFSETDGSANDFLGKTCKQWEIAVKSFQGIAEREVRIRTGVVLMKDDGALPKLLKPTKFGLGAAVGSGKQWMPFIHVEDLADIYIKAIEDASMVGAFNAAAPEHTAQTQVINQIAKTIGKPAFFPPIPSFIMKAVMGEMAEMITKGSRVSSNKLENAGFEFRYPTLSAAIDNLLK